MLMLNCLCSMDNVDDNDDDVDIDVDVDSGPMNIFHRLFLI